MRRPERPRGRPPFDGRKGVSCPAGIPLTTRVDRIGMREPCEPLTLRKKKVHSLGQNRAAAEPTTRSWLSVVRADPGDCTNQAIHLRTRR